MNLTVIACGSRNWTDKATIHRELEALHARYDFMVVVEGGAAGADRIAGEWAARMRSAPKPVGWLRVQADWKRYGTAAGPIRNLEMLDYLLDAQRCGDRVGVLAFQLNGSKGTANMVDQARKAGVPVKLWTG